jgi:hypothetical protein
MTVIVVDGMNQRIRVHPTPFLATTTGSEYKVKGK